MLIYQEFPMLLDLKPFSTEEEVYEQYDFQNCWTVQNPERNMARQDVAAALILLGGVYADVARVLRRNRTSVQNMVTRDPELFGIREEHKEAFLDKIESLHMWSALKGDLTAQRFFLTTLAKNRGYVTRQEATGADGKDLVPPTLTKEAISRMSPETMEELLRARDASKMAGE